MKWQWRQEDALPVDAGFIDATAPQQEVRLSKGNTVDIFIRHEEEV